MRAVSTPRLASMPSTQASNGRFSGFARPLFSGYENIPAAT